MENLNGRGRLGNLDVDKRIIVAFCPAVSGLKVTLGAVQSVFAQKFNVLQIHI
jgi:hypothetical protein